MKKRVRVLVSGMVQGVFYRASVYQVAARYGIAGFSRNLLDGRVEVVAEGEEPQLEKLIEWCRKGPPRSRVEGVNTEWSIATGQFQRFEIR